MQHAIYYRAPNAPNNKPFQRVLDANVVFETFDAAYAAIVAAGFKPGNGCWNVVIPIADGAEPPKTIDVEVGLNAMYRGGHITADGRWEQVLIDASHGG